MKHIIVTTHLIDRYPPILAAIRNLNERGDEIIVIGDCKSEEIKDFWRINSIKHFQISSPDITSNKIRKTFKYWSFKSEFCRISKNFDAETSLFWFFGELTIISLYRFIFKYKVISYIFEMPFFSLPLKFMVINPFFNYHKALQFSWKNVACEYNRAVITQKYFGLKNLPKVIPNKNFNTAKLSVEASNSTNDLINSIDGKKAIIYQGIYMPSERKIDELCDAINFLPDEFVVVILGEFPEDFKKNHISNRVFFHGFIPHPEYLKVTEKCYIGFMSYFAPVGDMRNILNTMFCAPNKIFEYSGLGLPFVANEVPALSHVLKDFNCGLTITDYSPESIAQAVMKIDKNYELFSQEAIKFFDSVNMKELFEKLLD